MSSPAELWGAGEYERIAERFAPIHDELVARLRPQPGERWLDVATGTGGVAVRAAQAGAEVTGVDIAPRLLEQARAKSDKVEWVEANAQALPFEDASFDVVSSSFGVIFAPEPEAAAAEIARVCRNRLGLTAWRPNEGLHAIYARFSHEENGSPADDWGREERVTELLGGAFELEFEERVWHLEGETPESVWELMSTAAPPVKALVDSLEPAAREELRSAMIAYWAGFSTDDGVSEPRRYLLELGRRR
ncbi:MAG: methyltransferase domain-containing protein [Gaiellaceae bacterium]